MNDHFLRTLIEILSVCPGQRITRHRLKMTIFLLQRAGLIEPVCEFEPDRYYGPYSEQFLERLREAVALELVTETRKETAHGIVYFEYSLPKLPKGLRYPLECPNCGVEVHGFIINGVAQMDDQRLCHNCGHLLALSYDDSGSPDEPVTDVWLVDLDKADAPEVVT